MVVASGPHQLGRSINILKKILKRFEKGRYGKRKIRKKMRYAKGRYEKGEM